MRCYHSLLSCGVPAIARLALLQFAVACRAVPDAEVHEAPRAPAQVKSATPVPAPSHAPAASAKPLAPLRGNWLEGLGASGSVLTLPLGASEPRPVILGVHGAGDRPEWSCGGWRLASGATTFVLCPRGSKMDAQRFAWASSKAIERALEAALSELKRRYPTYLASAPWIYAGFSQGATLSEPILLARAAEFPIAILAEGGYALSQSASFASAYYAAGGRRVVLVCGSRSCFSSAARAKPVLERAALQVLVVGDALAGHNLNERMQVALQRAWPEISAPL
jgi:predicted esterase